MEDQLNQIIGLLEQSLSQSGSNLIAIISAILGPIVALAAIFSPIIQAHFKRREQLEEQKAENQKAYRDETKHVYQQITMALKLRDDDTDYSRITKNVTELLERYVSVLAVADTQKLEQIKHLADVGELHREKENITDEQKRYDFDMLEIAVDELRSQFSKNILSLYSIKEKPERKRQKSRIPKRKKR